MDIKLISLLFILSFPVLAEDQATFAPSGSNSSRIVLADKQNTIAVESVDKVNIYSLDGDKKGTAFITYTSSNSVSNYVLPSKTSGKQRCFKEIKTKPGKTVQSNSGYIVSNGSLGDVICVKVVELSWEQKQLGF